MGKKVDTTAFKRKSKIDIVCMKVICPIRRLFLTIFQVTVANRILSIFSNQACQVN